MLKWVKVFLSSVIVFVVFVGIYLHLFAGLGYYLKSLWIIDLSPTAEIKVSSWNQFVGPDQEWGYGGILAGSMGDRIWVWGNDGLRAFTVDENSVYSWFDGCNEGVISQLNQGASGKVIEREIMTDMSIWREKVRVGDYMRVILTKPETGGTVGNMREIYTYNFWLFMHDGAEVRCAK